MSAQGVNTRMKRFTFVEKTAEQVGDGTDWPMLVTLGQIAEIVYRVRDAWFTSGSLTSPNITMGFQGTPGEALAEAYGEYDEMYERFWKNERGFNTIPYFNSDLAAEFSPYFGDEYFVHLDTYRDCVSEIGMWFPFYGHANYENEFRCGFSHRASHNLWFDDYPPPPPPDIYGISVSDSPPFGFALNVVVDFSGEVAYVGDNPLSPTSELYLGVRFAVEGWAELGLLMNLYSYSPFDYDTGVRFVIRLANGVSVSCKIYSELGDITGTDIVLEAKKWWPYAGPNGPIWEADTGLKL